MGFRYFSDVIMMVDLESICFPESSLQQRVRELEGAQVIRGTSSMAELGRLRKERDDLKEALHDCVTCNYVHTRCPWDGTPLRRCGGRIS